MNALPCSSSVAKRVYSPPHVVEAYHLNRTFNAETAMFELHSSSEECARSNRFRKHVRALSERSRPLLTPLRDDLIKAGTLPPLTCPWSRHRGPPEQSW